MCRVILLAACGLAVAACPMLTGGPDERALAQASIDPRALDQLAPPAPGPALGPASPAATAQGAAHPPPPPFHPNGPHPRQPPAPTALAGPVMPATPPPAPVLPPAIAVPTRPPPAPLPPVITSTAPTVAIPIPAGLRVVFGP